MALLTDVLEWLQALPQPALVGATGALVFAECTIGLGFIAPGEGGLLIAATTVDSVARFLVLWAVVTVCAGLGDSIGFAIGRRFGPRLRETKLIQKYGADGWDKATGILRRRGAWAVFFARFLPVVRTLTPAAAGHVGPAVPQVPPGGGRGRGLLVGHAHRDRRRARRGGEAHRGPDHDGRHVVVRRPGRGRGRDDRGPQAPQGQAHPGRWRRRSAGAGTGLTLRAGGRRSSA